MKLMWFTYCNSDRIELDSFLSAVGHYLSDQLRMPADAVEAVLNPGCLDALSLAVDVDGDKQVGNLNQPAPCQLLIRMRLQELCVWHKACVWRVCIECGVCERVCGVVVVCACVCAYCQVTVKEVNRVMGTPGVPFLDLLQSACKVGRNDVLRHLRQLPAAKLLRHSERSVSPGRYCTSQPEVEVQPSTTVVITSCRCMPVCAVSPSR